MDITSNTTVNTLEPETETPTRIQPAKPLSFSNGALTRHRHPHPVTVVSYKECLKNHAASLGGHAVDGCGEFMPSPTSTPADPTSLKCAACGCHRNFHRREPEDHPFRQPPNAVVAALEYQPHHRHHPPPPPTAARGGGPNSSPNDSPSPPPISSAYYPSAPHMLLALSSGFSDPPHAETPKSGHVSNPSSRKRFRTKFRKDQKEKMMEFAERLGWKMQRRDEDLINEFCSEIGVEKGVLKVWMHNNKYNFGRRDQPATTASTAAAVAVNHHHQNGNANGTDLGIGSGDIKIHNHESRNGNNIIIKEESLSLSHSHSHSQLGINQHHLHNSSVSAHVAAAINGSSSSSGA